MARRTLRGTDSGPVETYHPGAVDRVTAYAGGEEVDVWAGRDPTDVGRDKGVSVIGFKLQVRTDRVRVHLDSPRVPGWNEIDAVGLLDQTGQVHWARAATAGSTYGVATPTPVVEGR